MTQTIRERLEEKLRECTRSRLEKLRELNAPDMVIERLEKALQQGDLASRVGKIKNYGNLTVTGVCNQQYRQGFGALFTTAEGPQIAFIPGPYGWFLAEEEDNASSDN